MGNICRSPTAKGFFDHHVDSRGLQSLYASESAGTHGWHVGKAPDSRSIAAAAQFGIDISSDRSRQLNGADFSQFDWLLAMDTDNLAHARSMDPGQPGSGRLIRLLELDDETERLDVPDPYYGGAEGFDQVCRLLQRATGKLLEQLQAQR